MKRRRRPPASASQKSCCHNVDAQPQLQHQQVHNHNHHYQQVNCHTNHHQHEHHHQHQEHEHEHHHHHQQLASSSQYGEEQQQQCTLEAPGTAMPSSLLQTGDRPRWSPPGSLRAASRRGLLVMPAPPLLIGLLLAAATLCSQTTAALSYAGQPQQQQQHQSIGGLQQAMAQLLQVFNGNESQQQMLNDANHFKLLERDRDFLLVGARNVVYNLSLSSMREQRRLEWPSSEEDVKMCRVKGKSPDQCQNYIRVLKLQAPDTLFVCGTNAYKPRCRTYLVTSNAYELVSEAPGEGACPYQENQNVTSLFIDGDLYSATAAQFSGIDGLIHRSPLRTEQFNPKQLNSPNFVSSFRYGEHVYFLFRESAIEHINCGKAVYSRIARVCINDSGGSTRSNRERWTSFVKARLNCSIPGEYPFYFDEIQASTHVVASASAGAPQMAPPMSAAGHHGRPQSSHAGAATDDQPAPMNPATDLLYAVFTTPTNSIGGSAVCAFRMADVLAAFEGPFKSQADSNSNWLPVAESRVPQPRPGTCLNDSKRLPDENINFIKDNPLMDTAVEALWSQPLIMMASINFRFTQIVVDAQVDTAATASGPMRTDVIFVSTDDGRVFKLINTHHLSVAAAAAAAAASSSYRQGSNSLQPYYMSAAAAFTKPFAPMQAPTGPADLYGSAGYSARPMAARLVTTTTTTASGGGGQQATNREPLPDVSSATVVIEELHLFDSRTPILNMLIYYPPSPPPLLAGDSYSGGMGGPQQQHQHPKLVVLSGRQLKAIPLARCERALTCADCLALYDPYCAWDTRQQACTALGRSTTLTHSQMSQARAAHWFPPNNLASNFTIAWWSQCPPANAAGDPQPALAQVGAPFRSLFSSHLQVPSRFDYASGHHLAHTALVSLASPPQTVQGAANQQPANNYYRQPQPVSECLTFCGGLYTPQPMSQMQQQQQSGGAGLGMVPAEQSGAGAGGGGGGQQQLMMNCADYVQQHYIGGNLQSPNTVAIGGQASGSLYTSENLYFAVIICAVSGLVLGLLFGFAIGRNTRKHDSSICSSTFDETNLYMASTGSHHGAANLFAAPQQQQQQRILHHHSLLQQSAGATGTGGLISNSQGTNGISRSGHLQGNNQLSYEATGLLNGQETTGSGGGTTSTTYGNQQQMLLHLAGNQVNNGSAALNPLNNTTTTINPLNPHNHNGSIRSGALAQNTNNMYIYSR